MYVAAGLAQLAERHELDLEETAERLEKAKRLLYDARARRVWPGLDDKVLTAWNGLMLAAFAEAGQALDRPDYLQIASDNAQFLFDNLRGANGRLWRTWKAGGGAKYNGYLEDYAYLADGLLALYQSTFDPRWYDWAQDLATYLLAHFRDEENGAFFDTSDDHELLLYRPKDVQDNATPSANAMAATVLLKLSLYTGEGHYWDVAQDATERMTSFMARYPTGFAHWLCAAAFILGDPREVAIIGKPDEPDVGALAHFVLGSYHPNLVLAVGDASSNIPLLAGRAQIGGKPTAYVCRQVVCKTPVTDSAALREQLE